MLADEDLLPRKPKVILLVDDDSQFLSLGQELLEYLGYKALVAADGHQALEIFRQEQGLDLIILDVHLPHLDGYQLLPRLQSLRPDIKVIVASGFFTQAEIDIFLQAGVAGMIHKPFRAQQLHAEIIKVLGE
jgi:two-component system, cell cycle sensor histidine kinase and response regulator CckA